jgi:hypothetical protein
MIISSLWVPLAMFEPLKSASPAGVNAPPISVLVTLSGVLIALAGHLLTQARNAGESLEKQSRFYLDVCVQAYEEAQKLLLDGNNHRATWIAAARALKHAKALSEKVSVKAHRRVLKVHQLKYRGFFHGVLQDKPAAFFYGVKDTTLTTEEAAKLSTAPQERAGRPYFPINALTEKSLHAIWEATQFPEEYNDPLERGFSDGEKGPLLLWYPGLHEFLEHTEQWHSAAGKLYPWDKTGDR